ncbi:hypothetical protein BBP40_004016 [Aspergillus hancockii]|nr:hypothetical protein BBP40_004016 [Aspergillus hancockii]
MAGEEGAACGVEKLEDLVKDFPKDQCSRVKETEAREVLKLTVVGCQVEVGRLAVGEEATDVEVQKFFSQQTGSLNAGETKKREDDIHKILEADSRIHLPLRPGFGTQGEKIILYANYFQLSIRSKDDLHRYKVEVSEAPKGRKLKQIIALLVREHFAHFGSAIASDYKATLITCVPLMAEQDRVYEVRYKAEDEEEYPDNPRIFQAKVTKAGRVNPSNLLDELTSTNASPMLQCKWEVLHALNLVIGNHPKTSAQIASVSSNKHFSAHPDPSERSDLSAGLEVLRGFFVSVRAATSRFLLNCQVKYAACYREGELSALIDAYRHEGHSNIYRLGAFIRKLRVQVTHIRRQDTKGQTIARYKTITDFASPADGGSFQNKPQIRRYGASPREVQFWLDGSGPKKIGKGKPKRAGPDEPGRYVTVEQFFREKYNITVRADLPVVNVGTRQDPSYLPVEVCRVAAAQVARTSLSSRQTQNMIRFAVRSPAQNAHSIVTRGAELLGSPPCVNDTLEAFGVGLDPRLITVPGRVLPSPPVLYGSNKTATLSSGSWNMMSNKVSVPKRLVSWAFIYIVCDREREVFPQPADLKPCLTALNSKLSEIGAPAGPAVDGQRVNVTAAYRDGAYDGGELDRILKDAVQHLKTKHKMQLLLAILPSKNTHIYSSVKRVCDIGEGVRNVCVLAERLAGRNPQYLANVCLKVNLKLGGTNHILEGQKLGIISSGQAMVVGIDVTHPSPGSTSNAPSVAGMVASVDCILGQWPAELRIQRSRQEMVTALDVMLQRRLEHWMVHNKQLPENILVYRDGVSEGQYQQVVEDEVPLLKSACEFMYPAQDTRCGIPRLSVIVVGKRHHTRFYPTRDTDADRSSNPRNGTVVDRGLTEAREWDFFLQAHSALQGTARPAHYYVVWDEIFRAQRPRPPFVNTADILEDLTHNMCYLFGRATKAVSICPPAYYADLVCERARCYLKRVFDESAGHTPTGSVTEGDRGEITVHGSDVQIHPDVRDTMFYI